MLINNLLPNLLKLLNVNLPAIFSFNVKVPLTAVGPLYVGTKSKTLKSNSLYWSTKHCLLLLNASEVLFVHQFYKKSDF